jgi:hypothetical protein
VAVTPRPRPLGVPALDCCSSPPARFFVAHLLNHRVESFDCDTAAAPDRFQAEDRDDALIGIDVFLRFQAELRPGGCPIFKGPAPDPCVSPVFARVADVVLIKPRSPRVARSSRARRLRGNAPPTHGLAPHSRATSCRQYRWLHQRPCVARCEPCRSWAYRLICCQLAGAADTALEP